MYIKVKDGHLRHEVFTNPDDPEYIHVIKTGHQDEYFVIHENAYQDKYHGSINIMSKATTEQVYGIKLSCGIPVADIAGSQDMHVHTAAELPVGAKPYYDYREWAEKHLNQNVKVLVPVTSPEQGLPLVPAYMQVIVKGREPQEADIRQFCKVINTVADEGLIEGFAMGSVFGLPLAENIPTQDPVTGSWGIQNHGKRTLLCFYTFTRYALPYLQAKAGKYFMGVGEITNFEII